MLTIFGFCEFIAETVYGFYICVGTGLGEFLAQVLYLCINELEIVDHVNVVTPNGLGKYGLVYNVLGALHEVKQYVKLLFKQCDFLPSDSNPAATWVEGYVACFHVVVDGSAAAAHYAFYARR